MSAPTLKPSKPRNRLQRLATLEGLVTAITWVFWIFAVGTALQVILALTRWGTLFLNVPGSLRGSHPVWVAFAPPLLQPGGSVLIHYGLAPGVQAIWNG